MTDHKKLITTTTRLPADLHEQVARAAEEQDRPFNNFVVHALRDYLKRSQWLDDHRSSDDGK